MGPVPDDVRARLRAQTTQLWGAAGVTDLGIGQPQDAILPVEVLSKALGAAAAAGRPHPLQYGIEPGDGDLRVAVSDYLEPYYGFCPDPSTAFVTNGNSQAIDHVVGTLTSPGDVVLVEETTYFLAIGILRDHHVRVEPVAVDALGIVPEALADALRTHRPALLYTVPTFHNPTGATLPDERREQVVELCSEHGTLIVADEVYHLLSYPESFPDQASALPRPFAAWSQTGSVLSLGTFSKVLAPGLRLGWVHTDAALTRRLAGRGSVVSGGGLNPLVGAVVAGALADGSAADYLVRLRRILGERAVATDAALREQLPADVSWEVPGGGYFYWLRLPADVDPVALRAAARREGVDFRPGPLFSVTGGQAYRIRLSFAYWDVPELVAAVAALGRAFTAVR